MCGYCCKLIFYASLYSLSKGIKAISRYKKLSKGTAQVLAGAKKLALEEVSAFFGIAEEAFDAGTLVAEICSLDEQVCNAKNEKQLREAAKTFEHVVEAFGLIAVMSFMDVIGHKLKKRES